jgi:hypothetical protein
MCMLCVIPPNVIPSREKLENSALNNPHGFGFAIAVPKEKRIISERTMNADESINQFLKLRGEYPEGYAMWHARYATHGSMTIDNCHPFKLGGKDTRTYIGHNGILPTIEVKNDHRSDTRIFAEDILPSMGGVAALDNEQMYNVIENFTSGSKICVLSVDPRAKFQCYIIHEDKGSVDSTGVWWSNDSCYLDYGYSSTAKRGILKPLGNYTFFDSDIDDEIVICETCNTENGALEFYDVGACKNCGSCFDCSTYYTDCLCYKGKGRGVSTGTEGWKGGWDF